jgi:hypothetical protein
MVASFTRLGLNPRLATDYDPATGIHTLKITGGGGGGGGIPSIAGTANQIVQVGSPGAVTLSIANVFTFPGTVTNNLSIFGATTSAQLLGIISDETGSGLLVFNTSPTLVTPILGTPTSVTLTNATGLPVSTGISGLAAGIAAFLATPSSANLATAVTDETGTGALVFATNPVFVTPNLGTPSALTLTNATGLPLTGTTGTLPINRGGTGQTTASAAFDALSPMTTGGDLIYGGAAGTGTRLANGTAGQVLQSNGTTLAPTWVTPTSGGVPSIIGTANQINQSGSPGATTLTLSSTVQLPGSMTIGGGTIGTDKLEVTGSVTFNTGPVNFVSAPVIISGNISAPTWGGATAAATVGVRLRGIAGTLTDTTAATGTTAFSATDILGGNTIAATNAGVVFTNYISAYFREPIAGTNVTLTNKYGLGADSIRIGITNPFTLTSAGVGTFGGTVGFLNDINVNGDVTSRTGNAAGQIRMNITGLVFGTALDAMLARIGAANLRIGLAPSATPIANKLTIGEASIPGTSNNIGGANGTLQSGLGTGTGTLSSLILQSPIAVGSGTGAQTYATGLTILDGAAVLTNYTVANLPAAATVGAGGTAFVTDANTTFILGLGVAVVGGGANKVPVYSDGTNWIVG